MLAQSDPIKRRTLYMQFFSRLRYDRMNFFVAGFMPDPDDFEPGFHNDLVSKTKLNCTLYLLFWKLHIS